MKQTVKIIRQKNNERQAKFADSQASKGLVRVSVYIHVTQREAFKKAVSKYVKPNVSANVRNNQS